MDDASRAGGASTISGVVYQILWCLLRSLRIRTSVPEAGQSGNSILILEPSGGGGDVQLISKITEVDQLKAKADEGSWSLRAIIESVLPDLFIAAKSGTSNYRFRIVTEGRMGKWAKVYEFFQRLSVQTPVDDVLSHLDDTRELKFQRRTIDDPKVIPFFTDESYTERSLFLLIAKVLGERPAIKKLDLIDRDLHRKLWLLLGHFEFVGGQTQSLIEQQIDQLLLAVVDNKNDLQNVRYALAMTLMTKAGQGNVELTVNELFKETGIDTTPLTNWSEIVARSQDELQRRLSNRRYRPELDVRHAQSAQAAIRWRDSPRTIVITGESGQGKSWLLAGMALCSIRHDAPVIWVDATGNVGYDLSLAADDFWRTVRNGEEGLPLRQIANRLKDIVPNYGYHRLRLCFDNIASYAEAEAILRENWPQLGISIAITSPKEIAKSIKTEFGDRADIIECRDFTWEELHEYMNRSIGSSWTTVPEDIRRTLRRPLLASIYCEQLHQDKWHGTNEYDLFSAMWSKLSSGTQVSTPLDTGRMETLVLSVVRGELYPWSHKILVEHGFNDEALMRLERVGWLVRTGDNHVEISNDRLANWAVAQAFYSELIAEPEKANDIVSSVAQLNHDENHPGGIFFGYVPMDFLWLVSGRTELVNVGIRLLEILETSFGHRVDVFYRYLVPTLGKQVANVLYQRYRMVGDLYLSNLVREALTSAAGHEICRFASTFLRDPVKPMQRRGLKLLKGHACPNLLDQIWCLHKQVLEDPTPFLSEHEHTWRLRDDSWPALRSAAIVDPAWIVNAIRQAVMTDPVHELAWLVVNLKQAGTLVAH